MSTPGSAVSPSMNVGIFLASLDPVSAAEKRFQETIFNALIEQPPAGFTFLVLSFDAPTNPPPTLNIRYVRLEVSDGRLSRLASLWKLLTARVLRAVITFGWGGDQALEKALAQWARPEPRHFQQLRDLNIRVIWNLSQKVLHSPMPFIMVMWDVNHRIHSMYPEFSYARFGFDGCEANYPELLARASYVLVGTEEGKRQLIDLYQVHHGKVRVVPFPTPSLPEPRSDQPSIVTPDERYIFYPARFWPHKDHVVIVAALALLKRRWGLEPKCLFSGVDEGNLSHVLRFAESLGVRSQIEYVGSVSEADLAVLYRQAFALVYASAVGPDNLPPLEAMALGCPVITADVPGAREQYGDAALLFPPTDEEALAAHVKAMFDDPALRDGLIVKGRARASKWTPDDYVRSVTGILGEFAAIARAWERCDSRFT